LDIVLAHELVHIRRRDLLTGWLEVILTGDLVVSSCDLVAAFKPATLT
jgi:beta-lactamase regulating signal transducer with metallopeptidase domain